MADKLYKLAVFSDSHGNVSGLTSALDTINECDYFVFLGDGNRDIDKIAEKITVPVYRVRGNCDMFSDIPTELVIRVGETDFFLTHGNYYGVKSSFISLAAKAREQGCSYALFGHTHSSVEKDLGGVTVINPGTAARCDKSSFAIIEGDGKSFFTKFIRL